jgi:hypothetical protein
MFGLKNIFKKKQAFEQKAPEKTSRDEYNKVLDKNLANARKAIAFGVKELTPADRSYIQNRNVPYAFWGEDNLLPMHILRASALNNLISSVTEAYKEILVGNGYSLKTSKAKAFLKATGIDGIIERIAWDLVVFDGFAVDVHSVVKNIRFVPETTKHVPFSRVRFDKQNLDGARVKYYSALDWRMIDSYGNVRPFFGMSQEEVKRYEIKEYLPYSDEKGNILKNADALYVDYEYHPSNDYYPKSDIQTVTGFSLINEQAQEYHVNYFKNGIMGSIVINIPFDRGTIDDPTELARIKQAIIAEAQANWQGSQKAGQPFFNLYETDGDGQILTPKADISGFPGDQNDRKYIEMFKAVDEQMFLGLGVVVPAAFGLKDETGSLGKTDVMIMAYEQSERFRLKNKRKMIEKFVNTLIQRAGIEDKFELPYVPPVKPAIEVKQVVEHIQQPTEGKEAVQ